MRKIQMQIGELMLLVGTRALIGVGIGLLSAERLGPERRRAVGYTLLGVGLLTTIPLALDILGAARDARQSNDDSRTEENIYV